MASLKHSITSILSQDSWSIPVAFLPKHHTCDYFDMRTTCRDIDVALLKRVLRCRVPLQKAWGLKENAVRDLQAYGSAPVFLFLCNTTAPLIAWVTECTTTAWAICMLTCRVLVEATAVLSRISRAPQLRHSTISRDVTLNKHRHEDRQLMQQEQNVQALETCTHPKVSSFFWQNAAEAASWLCEHTF